MIRNVSRFIPIAMGKIGSAERINLSFSAVNLLIYDFGSEEFINFLWNYVRLTAYSIIL